ncbi:outer dynein arm-docking complex subunit 4 [Augochlora pura]
MAVLASGGHKDELCGSNEVRMAVEHAESRARSDHKRNHAKTGREFANALHREADQLYHSGDYESALVLYHRAANLFPRDNSHKVAVMRTTATISSSNNPPRATKRTTCKSEEQLMANLCPETAAILANEKLKRQPEAASVAEVLSYFDDHKRFWKTTPSPQLSQTLLARSKQKLRQLNNLADGYLEALKTAFDSGKMADSMKAAQELLMVSEALEDPSRYQIASYHYLSLIHVAAKRHDLAVCSVSRLIRLAKSTGDVVQFCRALVTLGKVHLSFGHLNAAARAWQHLAADLEEPIPLAWIRHEIGRCYLETGKYTLALQMALKCLEVAEEVNSTKWLLHGKLLLGQALAKLGSFAEASRALHLAAKITEDEGDTLLQSYIRDLIKQMTLAVRSVTTSDSLSSGESKIASSRNKKVTAKYEEEESSSESEDGETTLRSEQSDRRSSARSDLASGKAVNRGDTTFRVDGTGQKSRYKGSSSNSESSSFSDEDATEETGSLEECNLARRAEGNFKEGTVMLKCAASESSMNTDVTNATYVIDSQDEDSLPTAMKLRDGCERTVLQAENGKLTSDQMIEELAKQDLGLLQMATDLLLMTQASDRSPDSGDGGDIQIFRPVDRD